MNMDDGLGEIIVALVATAIILATILGTIIVTNKFELEKYKLEMQYTHGEIVNETID